jgi:hypothetical protein
MVGLALETVMAASVLKCIGRSPKKLYRLVNRMTIAVRLWDASQRLAAIERRRRALDQQSRWVILHRLELERRAAVLSGQTLLPARGNAPVLVRSMGRAVAR